MALPYAQTYFPPESSTSSILPICKSNIPEYMSRLEGVAEKKHVNKQLASAISQLPEQVQG